MCSTTVCQPILSFNSKKEGVYEEEPISADTYFSSGYRCYSTGLFRAFRHKHQWYKHGTREGVLCRVQQGPTADSVWICIQRTQPHEKTPQNYQLLSYER